MADIMLMGKNPNYIGAYDLYDLDVKEITVTIKGFKEEEVVTNGKTELCAVMYFEDIRIYRDHKNTPNRLNNCEQANVEKVIKSSNSQIDDIKKIIDIIGLDAVPLKLKEVMEYRLKYPDTSLSELSLIMSKETTNNITKSGLNHRLRKIKELREKLEGFKKNTN